MQAMVHMWKVGPFPPQVVPRDVTQVIRPGSKHPYTLRDPSSLSLVFKGSFFSMC